MKLLNTWWLQPLMLIAIIIVVLHNKQGVATGLRSMAIDTPVLLVLMLYAVVLAVYSLRRKHVSTLIDIVLSNTVIVGVLAFYLTFLRR